MSTPSDETLRALRRATGDPSAGRALLERIERVARRVGREVSLMEVCGTHTHAIAAAGLRRLMPANVRLVSGPGCPVCVTPIGYVDRAQAIAHLPGTTVCTFGDLLRVPSSTGSLELARAEGADVRVVYSAQDAVRFARKQPDRRVVFLAVGFETTAPTIAAALVEAERDGLENFLILPGHKVIPPPLAALCSDEEVALDGLLCPGHVSVIIGSDAYREVAAEQRLPCAVVGFTPNDVLVGVVELLEQIAVGRAEVTNLYRRVVRDEGNPKAKRLVNRFFAPADADWRGLGPLPSSGLELRHEYAHRDASRLEVELPEAREPKGCRCGEVLKGTITPPECPLFGRTCSPESAIGACMVSSEGTCAAWYRHERLAAAGSRS